MVWPWVAVKEPPFLKQQPVTTPRKISQVCDFCHLATLERKQIWLQILKSGESPILEALNYTLKIHQLFSGGPKKTSHNHLTRNKLLPASEELCSSAKTSRWEKKSPKSHGVFGQKGFSHQQKDEILFFRKIAFHAFAPKQCHCPICPLVMILLRNQVTRYGYHFSTRKRKASESDRCKLPSSLLYVGIPRNSFDPFDVDISWYIIVDLITVISSAEVGVFP